MKRLLLISIIYLFPLLCQGQTNNIISSRDTVWFEPGDLLNAYQEVILRIHPSLPTYRITFRVDQLSDNDSYSRTSEYILKVFPGDNEKPIQVIRDTTGGASFFIGNTYDDENEFPDINFDGYTDLPLTTQSYALGDRSYDFLLFDKESHKFKKSNFSELTNPLIYPDKKMISTNAAYGCYGYRCSETSYYNIFNDTLELIRRELYDVEQIDTSYYRISVDKEVINGEMRIVRADTSVINH